MTSLKIVQFSRPPTLLVHLHPIFFHPLDLGRPISNDPPPPPPPPQFQTKASLSASWLYTLVCAVVHKYHEMFFLFIIIHNLLLVLQLTCFISTTWKRKQTMEKQPHRACERMKSNQKLNQVMPHSNWPRVLLFDLAHKQCNGIIKG